MILTKSKHHTCGAEAQEDIIKQLTQAIEDEKTAKKDSAHYDFGAFMDNMSNSDDSDKEKTIGHHSSGKALNQPQDDQTSQGKGGDTKLETRMNFGAFMDQFSDDDD